MKLSRISIFLIFSTLAVGLAVSQRIVPHQFKPDTVARAGEVNANFSALEVELVKMRTELANVRSQISDIGQFKPHAGFIIPFFGTFRDAERLARYGWIVCDGRGITDGEAIYHLKGRRTPNLVGRFLLGDDDSGSLGGTALRRDGKIVARSSHDGTHQHGRELVPNPRHNRWFGDDENDNQFRNSSDGGHQHTVDITPPYYTVVYLMYVR